MDKMNGKIWQILAILTCLMAMPALAKAKKSKAAEAAAAAAPAHANPKDAQKPAAPMPETKPVITPQKFVESLYERMNVLSKSAATLDVLHAKIGEELRGVVDYPEMGRLALGEKWTQIDEAQKAEFLDYLTRMVQNTYVKRFKPGQAIEIEYGATPRLLADDRVQVMTTITVGKTTVEVQYALRPAHGRWWVYDIIVDEISQVQTYRKNFKSRLDKDGWPGLMKTMKSVAEKKV